jgi:hypothetical protein
MAGCPILIPVMVGRIFIWDSDMTHFMIGAGTGIPLGMTIIRIMVTTGPVTVTMVGDIMAGSINHIMLITPTLHPEETGISVQVEEMALIMQETIVTDGESTDKVFQPLLMITQPV